MEQPDMTGLKCLQLLFNRFRHAVNFPALLTPEVLERYKSDPVTEIMQLAQEQQLLPIRPEDGPRLEDAAGLDGGSSTSSVLQTGFLIMLASSPALKSGVTIDDTFQVFCLIFPSRQKQDKRFCNSPFRFSYNSIKANELGFICNVIEPSSSAVGKICV